MATVVEVESHGLTLARAIGERKSSALACGEGRAHSMTMIDPSEMSYAEQVRAWKAAQDAVDAFTRKERAEKYKDPEVAGRDFLIAVAFTRRLVREGVAKAPSDWDEHVAWSNVQRAMAKKLGIPFNPEEDG